MRSRFFGASSYDDEDDEDEMDLSGFVTSSETQPVVVERKRAPKADTGATEASNMGNAGPRTAPPPPMSEMGYRPSVRSPIAFKDSGEGSPWNPFWASDDSRLKKPAVISKSVGMLGMALGVGMLVSKDRRSMAVKMIGGSSLLYAHPALGWGYGHLENYYSESFKGVKKFGTHAAPYIVYFGGKAILNRVRK